MTPTPRHPRCGFWLVAVLAAAPSMHRVNPSMGEILNVSRVGAPTTMRGTVALLIAFGCTADALKLSAPRSSARPVVARARAVVACEAEEPKKLKKPKVESEASRRAALMKENERAYNEEEEKACRQRFEPPLWDNRLSFFPHTFPGSNRSRQQALRICRIEFAPYPAGKYNKMASDEEGGVGKAAAYDQVRKDLPALASWSDLEIESTFTALKVRLRLLCSAAAFAAVSALSPSRRIVRLYMTASLLRDRLGSALAAHRRRQRKSSPSRRSGPSSSSRASQSGGMGSRRGISRPAKSTSAYARPFRRSSHLPTDSSTPPTCVPTCV